jgi:primosomal protein N'
LVAASSGVAVAGAVGNLLLPPHIVSSNEIKDEMKEQERIRQLAMQKQQEYERMKQKREQQQREAEARQQFEQREAEARQQLEQQQREAEARQQFEQRQMQQQQREAEARQQLENQQREAEARQQLEQQMQQQQSVLAGHVAGPPDSLPRATRGGSPSTQLVLSGADAAVNGIAEALREGKEVLGGLSLSPYNETIMADETAHLKRDAVEQEETDQRMALSLNRRSTIMKAHDEARKRGRRESGKEEEDDDDDL